MVVYAGLPPAMMIWQEERDKKNKFVQWLRSNGFMVVTKDGSPAEEGRYKANVDVMMAIDALELSVEMQPDVVILVTGDTDFAYLAIKLRRRGIRVEVASISQNLGNILRSAANEVIDLAPLFRTFEMINTREPRRTPASSQGACAIGGCGSDQRSGCAGADIATSNAVRLRRTQTPASVSPDCYIAPSGPRFSSMGHSKGRDNAKKRARRRKKTKRL